MAIPVPSKTEVIANSIARMGRSTDTELAHVSKDDLVIPREIVANSPELQQVAFNAMKAAGADPMRYVVGSRYGSYHPETKKQEFFFKDLVRIAAPAVIGSTFDLGNIGNALTSAGVTKLTGGSWGESLASGAGSYIGSSLSDYFLGQGNTLMNDLGETGLSMLDMAPSGMEGMFYSALNTPTATYAGALGGYAGGKLYDMYQDYTAAKTPNFTMPTFASLGQNNTVTMPLPNSNNQTPLPAIAGSDASGGPAGVSFLSTTKNRNTGRTEYNKLDPNDEELNRSSRAMGWGNVMTI